jgi:hypothetical protein
MVTEIIPDMLEFSFGMAKIGHSGETISMAKRQATVLVTIAQFL